MGAGMGDLTFEVNGVSITIPASELSIRTSRSGGPGGQNDNKLETKVEVEFDVAASAVLSPEQKKTLADRLRSRISSAGVLKVSSQESRSQWSNREDALRKLAHLLRKALAKRKKRLPTKPTSASRERRLQSKKKAGEKKRLRRFSPD